jgi:ATP-dependent DNA ligase
MSRSIKLMRHDRRYMELEVDGATVNRTYGVVGTDAPQRTGHTYEALNVGKKNERTPEQVASDAYDREVERFKDSGYQEVESFSNAISAVVLDLDNPSKSFCVSKPKTEISDALLTKLMEKRTALFQVKENGLCHWIFKAESGTRIYTRRMDDMTAKYVDIVNYVQADNGIPCGTILAVELIVPEGGNQMQRFRRMCSISRSDVVKGACKPDQSASHAMIEVSPVQAVVFHAPYWAGVMSEAYWSAWERIKGFSNPLLRAAQVIPIEGTAETARAWVDLHKDELEGLVCWDLEDSIEISFTGTPKRRNAYKMKPIREADVIAIGYETGTGKRQGKVGALKLAQINPETGEYVDCGKIGSGLTDETAEPSYWSFPEVIMIEYSERFEETGKFQFPRLVGKHPDKKPEECVYDGE